MNNIDSNETAVEKKLLDTMREGLIFIFKNPIIILLEAFVYIFNFVIMAINNQKLLLGVSIIQVLILIFISSCIALFVLYKTQEIEVNWNMICKTVTKKYIIILMAGVIVGFTVLVGLTLFIIPGIFIFVKIYFFVYAILYEDKSIFESIKRSWNITKGYWWKIFAIFIPFIIVGVALNEMSGPMIIVSFILTVIIYTWQTVVFSLFYIELINEKKVKQDTGKDNV